MIRKTEHPPARPARSASHGDPLSAPELSAATEPQRPASSPPRTPDEDEHAALIDIIKGDIIPRLMLVHQHESDGTPSSAAAREPVSADIVDRLANVAAGNDDEGAFRIVEAALADGLSLEGLLLNLVAPAAEQLGLDWENDTRDFSSVTIGLWRLHVIVREFAPRYDGLEMRPEVNSILIAPAPGEQHTLGPLIAAEFFHRAGWAVTDLPVSTQSALSDRLAGEHFDVLGLSVASDMTLGTLAGSIRDLRDASRNPDLGILVGGGIFAKHANLTTRVGADALCLDPRQAPQRARELVAFKNKKSDDRRDNRAFSQA